MSEDAQNKKDGGDISSGFGEGKVDGPVSDAKAQEMLHEDGGDDADRSSVFAVDSEGTASEQADDSARPDAAGGGGGGGW